MSASLRCTVRKNDVEDFELILEVISSSLFELGATAVGEERPTPDEAVLVAGFVSLDEARHASSMIEEAYGPALDETVTETHGTAWEVSQRAGLRPTQIGPWHIRAPWDPATTTGEPRHQVIIDPGAAFGHGAHPSTVMAIELLLRSHHCAPHLIDVGTGTGVIAIVGARLGMTVTALEVDPVAAVVAQLNIEHNSLDPGTAVDEHIEVRLEDARDLPKDIARDVMVVANVTVDVHRGLSPVLRSASVVIASGILCRQVAEVIALYPDHEAKTIRTHGEWASVELRRHKRLAREANS